MAQSWMFSVVNVTYAVCCIANIFVSSLGVLEPLCVNRNFDDIVCRWKTTVNLSENGGHGAIIALKFSKKSSQAFEECVESNDISASGYSSCVWDYPAAWVNETLSIKVVSSNQSANTSTVFDYDPKENVMLSPPVLNFTRRKIDDNLVNVTMNIAFANQDIEKKILANCGHPEVNVIFKRRSIKSLEEYTEGGSWGDWRQAKDGNSWHLHPFLRKECEEKTLTHYGKQVSLGLFPVSKLNESYLTQVRWRVNNSLCRSYWGPYRKYRFTTENIHITAMNIRARPGENVTVTCESTVRVSKFKWIVSGNETTSLSKRSENGFVSYLHLDNVKTGIYTVECLSTGVYGSSGIVISVGVAPPPPVVECLMENKERLHCRYNICNLQVEKQHKLYTNRLAISWRSKPGDRSGHTENFLKSCYVSDTIENMKYDRKIVIKVRSSNIFGEAISELNFVRDDLIHPSSPLMKLSIVGWNQGGAAVNISAQFPQTKSSNQLHRYCGKFTLRIGSKVIPNYTDINQIKFVTDSDFWVNWEKGEDELNKKDAMIMKNATFEDRMMTMPSEVDEHSYGHEAVEVQVSRRLAANTRYLMALKWKFESGSCQGDWSIPSHRPVRIGNIKPPRFRDVTLIFLSGDFRLPGNFRGVNWTGDTVIVVWNNIDEAHSEIQEHNIVEYKLVASGGRFVRGIPCRGGCNAILSTGNYSSLFKVNAMNEKGIESSATFRRTEISVERCAATVMWISLASISDSHLVFKVDWIYARMSPPHDCVISQLEQRRIHVHLLAWREINPNSTYDGRSQNTGIHTEEPPLNATVYAFNLTVVRSAFRPTQRVFGTRVSTKSENVNFTYPFQADSAYGMGVALSEGSERLGVFNQSSAIFDANLYYFARSPEQSKGGPEKLIASDIGTHEMKISWLPSKPQERNSPVIRYEIFAKYDKRCSFRHDETVCNLQEVDSKDCYEKPDKIYEVGNMSGLTGWKIEERKYNDFMSVRLENLAPGTLYYIIVWEVTEAGRNKCFRHVAERTLLSGHIWIVFGMACVFFIVAGISLVAFRRKVKKIFGIDIPEPRIWISWKDADTNEQPVTKTNSDGDFLDDDESNHYVALSRSREMTSSNVDTNSDILDDERPLMITITKQESAQWIDIEQKGPQNNNELQKLCRSDCHLEVESPAICATSVDSLGKTLTESSSVESDEPCCSTSSAGNIGDLWPRVNSACEAEEEAEDAYVSASEAASMSWPLGLENSEECLLKQLT